MGNRKHQYFCNIYLSNSISLLFFTCYNELNSWRFSICDRFSHSKKYILLNNSFFIRQIFREPFIWKHLILPFPLLSSIFYLQKWQLQRGDYSLYHSLLNYRLSVATHHIHLCLCANQ